MGGRGQSEGGGYGDCGSQAAGTGEVAAGLPPRFFITDAAVRGREYRLLQGIDAGYIEAPFQVFGEPIVAAQQLAGFGKQGVMFRTAEIDDPNAGRVDLPAGPADRDQPDPVMFAVCDQCSLDAKAVDTVDDIIAVLRQQRSRYCRRSETPR